MHTPTQTKPLSGGTQRIFRFPNGLGASVVSHRYSYGGENGLWELAVLDAAGGITYATPITADVIGWLTEEQVQETLGRIAALSPDEIRQHGEDRDLKDDWKHEVDSDQTVLGFEAWKAAR